MTRNLSIATIFLLGSALLLGYIWVREHYVLDARTERFSGSIDAVGSISDRRSASGERMAPMSLRSGATRDPFWFTR